MPLQENLGGEDGKGVLTGAELGSAASVGVEADKWLDGEEVPVLGSPATQEQHGHEEHGGRAHR
jgi:hypothetical protein